jgi:hypothetical protein
MRVPVILLVPAVALLAGCAGTMSDPIPSRDAAVAKCRSLGGSSTEGIQPPKLVKKGKSWRGFVLGSGGYACVQATVTVEGKLTEPEILSTDNKTFADAYAKSLSGFEYEPARKDGKPVAVKVVLTGWWADTDAEMSLTGEPVAIKAAQGP